MIRIHSRPTSRPGFTLIELLVVIAIIAVLVSLTSAAVMKAFGTADQVKASTDIAQLGTGLGAFMSDYNLSDPPPSVLVLSESAPLSGASGPFLQKMFGKNLGPTDWNGDGTINGPWTLEGEQCLIFYLGGIPSMASGTPQCLGFSYNNLSPSTPGGRRHGPYLTFQSSRLVPGAGGFFVYTDPWKVQPFAYFSSSGIANAYGANCPSIGASPYSDGAGHFLNPNTYQIICAGPDRTFGNGLLNPVAVGPGADDRSNFSSKILGAGQQ